jgi:hypothetical protein
VRLAIDEQPQREIWWSLRFEHVSFPLRRFGLADVGEGQRIRTERSGKHSEGQPDEVLLDCRHARVSRGVKLRL